tara:strand:- start:2402 stop:2641 length:240 start_codon:yes stop_codon:yes gene_type:complete
MKLGVYQSIDLYPDKAGVQPIIKGFLWEFRPWYFDGHTVWWGSCYPLRSDAEKAALKLQQQFKPNDNSNSLKTKSKNKR